MNNSNEPQQSASISLDDALYIFFRHKWKIILFSLVGFSIAAWIYATQETEFRSQAKLLVRYITERKNPLTSGPDEPQQLRPLDPRDSATMNAEAEIVRSTDCILEAVKYIGPLKVM